MKRRKLSKQERLEIYQKLNGHCAYCGCEITYKDMQVDHFKSLMHGGEDNIDNMLPACRSCNHYKGPCELEDFRKSIERFPAVLMRDSVTYKNAVRYGLVIQNPNPIVFYFERTNKENGSFKYNGNCKNCQHSQCYSYPASS